VQREQTSASVRHSPFPTRTVRYVGRSPAAGPNSSRKPDIERNKARDRLVTRVEQSGDLSGACCGGSARFAHFRACWEVGGQVGV